MAGKAEILRDEYRMRFSATEKYRNEVWKILCAEYFNRHIAPGSTVLDLGSGWGEFINNVAAAKKYAMDLNPDARTRLVGDVTFLAQDCSRKWKVRPRSLDVVFTSNFLEHLPDKASVERTLAEAYRCLKPGGQIICMGPNVKYLPGSYWDFWDHFVPITEDALAEVLRLKGFEVPVRIGRFMPYSMSTGRTPPLLFVRWYLKLPFVWRFFGKQFLVIARKAA